jgi:hypothetical protein
MANCSLKQRLLATGYLPPIEIRPIIQADPSAWTAQGYSMRKFLTTVMAPVIEAPSGSQVSPAGVVIRWSDPGAGLCNAATRFTVSLNPDQGQTLAPVVPPNDSTTVGYALYYQRQYTVVVESYNAAGGMSAQGSFSTASQPAPTQLSPSGGGVSLNPTLTWVDPGVVPAAEFEVTIFDLTHKLGPVHGTVTTTSWAVPYQLVTGTEYQWSVRAKYPGNTAFGNVSTATFGTFG